MPHAVHYTILSLLENDKQAEPEVLQGALPLKRFVGNKKMGFCTWHRWCRRRCRGLANQLLHRAPKTVWQGSCTWKSGESRKKKLRGNQAKARFLDLPQRLQSDPGQTDVAGGHNETPCSTGL